MTNASTSSISHALVPPLCSTDSFPRWISTILEERDKIAVNTIRVIGKTVEVLPKTPPLNTQALIPTANGTKLDVKAMDNKVIDNKAVDVKAMASKVANTILDVRDFLTLVLVITSIPPEQTDRGVMVKARDLPQNTVTSLITVAAGPRVVLLTKAREDMVGLKATMPQITMLKVIVPKVIRVRDSRMLMTLPRVAPVPSAKLEARRTTSPKNPPRLNSLLNKSLPRWPHWCVLSIWTR